MEDQATDRTYRIGQTKNVQVHKLITMGTLEEKIDGMLESKRDLADRVVGSGEGWLTELDDDALRRLVSLEPDADIMSEEEGNGHGTISPAPVTVTETADDEEELEVMAAEPRTAERTTARKVRTVRRKGVIS